MSSHTKYIVLIVLVCLGVGYYAWQKQQKSFAELEQLKSGGVEVAFSLTARPLLAVDTKKQALYLLGGNGIHNAIKIPFAQVVSIKFVEARVNNPQDDEVKGADTMLIKTKMEQQYRIGDLRKTAQATKDLFERYGVLKDKLSIKHRR